LDSLDFGRFDLEKSKKNYISFLVFDSLDFGRFDLVFLILDLGEKQEKLYFISYFGFS
jgi:hypothetical protein